MSSKRWEIGQEVQVAPRTWPGINKPGGHGKIVKIHFTSLGVVDSLDVKYTLGNNVDTNLETDLVKHHVELDRGRRSRRGRDFFTVEPTESTKAKPPPAQDDKENKAQSILKKDKIELEKRKKSKLKKKGTSNDERKRKNVIDSEKKTAVEPKKRSKSDYQVKKSTAAPKKPPNASTGKNEKTELIPKVVVTKAEVPNPISPLLGGNVGNTPSARTTINRKTSTAKKSLDDNLHKKGNSTAAPAIEETKQSSLKDVYNKHYQEATEYINRLVGPSQPIPKTAIEPPKKKSPEEMLDDERRLIFGKRFSELAREGGMMVNVSEMHENINNSLPAAHNDGSRFKHFTDDEINRYVARLCSEEKVMQSEGTLYMF